MIALHNAAAQSIAVSGRLSSTGYSGETFDAASQQQYLRARFYNPGNGRFNRLDPFVGNNTDPQSLHKYAYVHGDPIGGTDPTGKSRFWLLRRLRKTLNLPGLRIFPAVFASFAILQGASDIRNYSLKQFSGIDKGGYDATPKLNLLRADVIAKWGLLSDPAKQTLVDQLHEFPGGLTRWDIDAMLNNKKSWWTRGMAVGSANETLTFRNRVYPVADVNYVLWGLINRLAYDDNISPILTSKATTVSSVIAYRSILGGVFVLSEYIDDLLSGGYKERYDTTYGRAAFAAFGWEWAGSVIALEPIEDRLPNSRPNSTPWILPMLWGAGSNPRSFQGVV